MPAGHWSKGPAWLVTNDGVLWFLPGRRIAIRLQNLPNGRLVLGDDAVVPGIAGRRLADHAKADRVMIAPGDQGGTRGRAQRGGLKLRVAQPHIGDAIERRRWDDAAECARCGEAHVVGPSTFGGVIPTPTL